MKFFDLMKRAANEAGLELTELQYEQFIKYMRLLQEWNEKINLIKRLELIIIFHGYIRRKVSGANY